MAVLPSMQVGFTAFSLFNFGSRTALHTNSLLEQAVIVFERKTRRDAMYGITFQRLRCKARLRS